MQWVSKKELVRELLKANDSFGVSILDKKVPMMRYMARRTYSTEEFLDVVISHIQRHTRQVRRAKSRQA